MSGLIGTSHSKSKVIDSSRDTAKAWVQFSEDTEAGHFNVSSVTDVQTAEYRVNFANPMANTNYAFALSADNYYDGLDARSAMPQLKKGGLATGSITVIYGRNQTGSHHDGYDTDARSYSVIIFGD